MNSIAQTNQSEKQLSEKMQSFLSRYHVGRLLRTVNAYKLRSFPALSIFFVAFSAAWCRSLPSAYKNIRCVMRGRYRSSWKFSCPSCRRCCHKSCENVHNKGVFPVTKLCFSSLDDCF